MGRGEGKIATGRFRLTDRAIVHGTAPCSALFQENGVILDISSSQNSLRVLFWYLTS